MLSGSGIPPCHVIYSPCQHKGQCTELNEYEFECDCEGTGYKGETCTIGTVEVPPIPVIDVSLGGFLLSVTAYPDVELGIQILGADGLIFDPAMIWIYPDSLDMGHFFIQTSQEGIHTVSFNLTGVNAAQFETPDPIVIVAVDPNSNHTPNTYFTQLEAQVGQLKPGCCNPGGQVYQCLGSSATISFMSVCYWTITGTGNHISNGVVFMEGPGLLLPLSIAGSEIYLLVEGEIGVTLPSENVQCEECAGGDDNCYHYQFTADDLLDFLIERALGKTYLNQSSVLIPDWLQLSFHSLTSLSDVTFTDYDFAVSLLSGSQVASLPGCQLVEVNSDRLYAVLRYRDNITAFSNDSVISYGPEEYDLPICIAIDMCQGSASPVHFSIPTSSQQSIREFPAFQKYVEKGWNFGFYEALVSANGIVYNEVVLSDYWSGSSSFVPNVPKFDLLLKTSFDAKLTTAPNLWLNFSFTGDLYHQSNPTDYEVLYTY